MRRSSLALTILLAGCVADAPRDPLGPGATGASAAAENAPALFAPSWQLVDYGDGGESAILNAVNASGVAVGLRTVGRSSVPVMTQNGQLVDIVLPRGAVNGSADDINDAGEIVGAYKIGYTRYAYHRSAAGVLTVLPALAGDTWMRAWGMNNAGQVVGNAGDHLVAVLWARTIQGGWKVTSLGSIDSAGVSDAFEINDLGWVVGHAESGGYVHAFLKKPGQAMQDLGTLGGHSGTGVASGINNAGTVVGRSSGGATGGILFQYTSGSGKVNLTSSHPLDMPAINEHGRIAANGIQNQFYTKAFTFKAGILQYLPAHTLGVYTKANRINRCGTIAGASGTHAVLWKPVLGTPPMPVCD